MYKSFKQIEEMLLEKKKIKTLALANAQDLEALSAVVFAKNRGVINPVLIGEREKINALLRQLDEDVSEYRIIDCDNEADAANLAMQLVAKKEADIPMKGLMQTASFMKAVLNKEYGFVPPNSLISQVTVLDWSERGKFLLITDCAINISPDLEAKEKMIKNAVSLAHKLGIEKPKVAVISAVEVVKDKISSTVDAKALSEMPWEDCIVGGPFALDNAVSIEAAHHKGINHPVAGDADILIMPDLCTGNVFTKSLTFFAHLESAGAVCGTSIPVVMTSRSDTPENKYQSILTAIMQSME